MSRTGPDHNQHQGQDTAFHDGSGHWVDNSNNVFQPSHHSTPVNEYHGFAFTSLPMEPVYTAGMHLPRTTHQQLQPLIMPQWPSMLTSQSTYMPPMFPTAPAPVEPASTPISATSTGSRPASTPRKTLTDADRRRMCLYREEHPNVKQTEIGAMFGVERSTVSKVLRNKEKYMCQDDGSRSPIKRPKGKFPDIERALSNWARNHQKQGLPLSDAMIKEKARFFATTVGSSESHLKTNSSSWLEKFKHKNNLKGAKSRKSSFAEDAEAVSSPTSKSETPSGISPVSPEAIAPPSPVPMSASKSEDGLKTEGAEGFIDFTNGHRPFHSQSNASLSSVFTDMAPSSFSPGPTSPTSPFFTPDSACGPSPFIPQSARVPSVSNETFQRPRSQTFPALGIEPYVSPPSSEPLTPKYIQSSALDSPISELPPPLSGIEGTMAGPSTSMQPPPLPASAVTTSNPPAPPTTAPLTTSLPLLTHHPHSLPVSPASSSSSPTSPSQEDARRALELVMNFFQQQPTGFVEPQEYVAIGKLMEKLRLHPQHKHQQMVRNGEMPGGMHRIPEQEFGRKVE